MKLNIKMQKQNPQCPHCLQCVCSGLFSCHTQLRLLRRAKRTVFVTQFILGFQRCRCLTTAVPGDSGGGEVMTLLHGVWSCTETVPKGLAEGEGKDIVWKSQEWVDSVGNMGMEHEGACHWLQEQQYWDLCFWAAGLHLTSKQSGQVSAGTSAVSLLAGSVSEVKFLMPSRFNWDYAFLNLGLDLNCLFL